MGRAPATLEDRVRFSRPVHLPGLELVAARYRNRAFPRHAHEEYVLGTMTAGTERLSIRGCDHIIGEGDLILIDPGEPHSNCAASSDIFAYAVFYIPTQLIDQALRDLAEDAPLPPAHFSDPIARDPKLARTLARMHALLSRAPEALEQESGFLLLLSKLFTSRKLLSPRAPSGREHERVNRARDYLEARFRQSVSLRELGQVACLSPFHLLRSFKDQFGLPPAAYQTQRRIVEAKRLLRVGSSIADAAAEVGFVDQSHLNRHFQRMVGTTPGRYAQQ